MAVIARKIKMVFQAFLPPGRSLGILVWLLFLDEGIPLLLHGAVREGFRVFFCHMEPVTTFAAFSGF